MKVYRDEGGVPVLVGECALTAAPRMEAIIRPVFRREPSGVPWPRAVTTAEHEIWHLDIVQFRGQPGEKVIRLRPGDDPSRLPGFVAA